MSPDADHLASQHSHEARGGHAPPSDQKSERYVSKFRFSSRLSLLLVGVLVTCFWLVACGGSSGPSGGGGGGSTETPLRVIGAVATSSDTVIVSFNKEVQGGADSAEYAGYYTIVSDTAAARASLSPQAVLSVFSAVLNEDKKSVTLTTLQQSDITYSLTVTNVKDLQGNVVVPPDRENPYQATFTGKAASGPALDSDGDGVPDAVEQRGWTVKVVLGNGETTTRQVTSDPGDPTKSTNDPVNVAARDTDKDGLEDKTELAQLFDPRNEDTDADELSDYAEYNEWFSSGIRQDTDDDGLTDGEEVNLFFTSPIKEDTDGDSFLDGSEQVINNNRPRALLADIPSFDINIGQVDLQLDYRFNETVGETTTEGTQQSTNEVSLKSATSTSTQQDSYTQNWFFKAGTELCWGGACQQSDNSFLVGDFVDFGAKFTAEAGTGGESSFVSTDESARMVQNEYSKSLAYDKEVSAETTVTREVFGAKMVVDATFVNKSSVSYVLSDLEFTAQIVDPADPERFKTIGKLVSTSNSSISLSPVGSAQASKGLVIEDVDATPSVVEELMRNPRTILVELTNYKVTLAEERDYVFDLQNVQDLTAQIEIDYSGKRDLERLNPANYAGFEPDGSPKGITLGYFMQKVLGLEHIQATPSDGNGCTETTANSKLASSYATCMISVNGQTIDALWRVKDVSRSNDPEVTSWWVITPENGLITPVPEADEPWTGMNFNDYELTSGEAYAMKFVVDKDKDLLDAALEASLGTSDDDSDSDDDGIQDALELYGLPDNAGKRRGWPIEINGVTYYTTSNPARKDSDLDGLTDCQELLFESCGTKTIITVHRNGDDMNLKGEGSEYSQVFLPNRTDPSKPDTDGEGLLDGVEVAGLIYDGLNTNLNSVKIEVLPKDGLPATDPLDPTTDSDALDDYAETQLGTDPTVDDGDKVLDNDGDGLVNLREVRGWTVTWQHLKNDPFSFTVKSDPNDPNSDSDALTDWEEYHGCRDKEAPRFECDSGERFGKLVPMDLENIAIGVVPGSDSDQDGLTDDYEVDVSNTKPTYSDTDGDNRLDGQEVNTSWTVRLVGETDGVEVTSNPNDPDEDGDEVNDSQEFQNKTHPQKSDTDGDGVRDDIEIKRQNDNVDDNNTNPLGPDQLLRLSFDARAVRWTNGLICGVVGGGATTFKGVLRYTVNGVETSHNYSQYLGSGWSENVASGREIIRFGDVDVRSTDFNRLDGDVKYNLKNFSDAFKPENQKTFFAAPKNKVYKLQQQPENNDVCAMEIRFNITPIKSVD